MTNKDIVRYQRKIDELESKILDIQMSCDHDYRVRSTFDDHDGYSQVKITYYQDVVCSKCGDSDTREVK